MSYKNSDKEFYYGLYHKLNPEKLERILNVKLGEIELEKNFNGRKVDLYSFLCDGRQLFLELQLSPSDNIHLEQITRIIKSKEINNVIIIWVATEFKTTMLGEIEKIINVSCKNIYFMALKLNEKLIGYLQVLNNIFVNQVIENLKILDEVENQFKIIEIFYRLQDENNVLCSMEKEVVLDLNNKQDVMQYLLQELRRQIAYYPSIYRDKRLENNVIVLGAGKAEINYFIGLNRRNQLYVEIRFGEKQKQLFESFMKREDEVCDVLDYMAEFDTENRKIGTYLHFNNNKRKMLIRQIARITHKYIQFFSQYTYPSEIEKKI